jgi:hypothetical protein
MKITFWLRSRRSSFFYEDGATGAKRALLVAPVAREALLYVVQLAALLYVMQLRELSDAPLCSEGAEVDRLLKPISVHSTDCLPPALAGLNGVRRTALPRSLDEIVELPCHALPLGSPDCDSRCKFLHPCSCDRDDRASLRHQGCDAHHDRAGNPKNAPPAPVSRAAFRGLR